MKRKDLSDLAHSISDPVVERLADREIEIRGAVAEYIRPDVDEVELNQGDLSMHVVALCLAAAEECMRSPGARKRYRKIVRVFFGDKLKLTGGGKRGGEQDEVD